MSFAAIADGAQSEHGAQELLDSFRSNSAPTLDPSELRHSLSDPNETTRLAQSGGGFLSRFLGDRFEPLIDQMTRQSGLNRSSASKLIGFAAPLALGVIGKQVMGKNLDARGLSHFLAGQRKGLAAYLPSSWGGMLGGTTDAARMHASAEPERAGVYQTARKGEWHERRGHEPERWQEHSSSDRPKRRGLGWLIASLLALAVILLFWSRRNREVAENVTPETPAVVAERRAPDVPPAPERRTPEATPPEEAPAGSAKPPEEPSAAPPSERQPVAGADVTPLTGNASALQRFLAGSAPVPQRFVLEDLQFETGSTRIQSSATLDAVAEALKGRPSARVRIEGYTDREGSAEANATLSQSRATAVQNYLVGRGVPANQLQAVGMSESNPVAENDTSGGRAQNRRVELVVTQR